MATQGARTASDYQIRIVCALAIEQAAMKAMLDDEHPKLSKVRGDDTDYTLGRIGVHNVVLACLSAGLLGNGPAAIVATNMKRSFPIKFGLMVGVGGGVPSASHDIRLGDVVVSQPADQHGGVVQWDLGKTEAGGAFRRTGSLDKPPRVLLNALQSLITHHHLEENKILENLSAMYTKKPRTSKTFAFPGVDRDLQFEATYDHEGSGDCLPCDVARASKRDTNRQQPKIHYGTIASGNQVMKDGLSRDRISNLLGGVMCFEMEAAGLDDFRCLVIRGICDYSDSHKNKDWQPYAAATAAAFAKEFLGSVDEQEVLKLEPAGGEHGHWMVPFSRNTQFVGREETLSKLQDTLYTSDTDEMCQRVAVLGLGGIGKTQIAIEIAYRIRQLSPARSVFWVPATDKTRFEQSYLEIGRLIQAPGINKEDANVRSIVQRTLSEESTRPWLLIVDNADDMDLMCGEKNEDGSSSGIAAWLPASGKGSILFTTRTLAAAVHLAEANVLNVGEMGQEESKELWKRSLISGTPVERADVFEGLYKILTGLPLAIKQATAYINRKKMTLEDYLEIYKSNDKESIQLLGKDFEDRTRYPNSVNPVLKTWYISFSQILESDPLAAEYLCFMACLAEHEIPTGFFPKPSPREFKEAVGTLEGYAFITKGPKSESYRIHRLVQLATSTWIDTKGETKAWRSRTLTQMDNVFPKFDHMRRDESVPYLPHALHVVEFSGPSIHLRVTASSLLHTIAGFQHEMGKYGQAETLNRRCLQYRKEILERHHPDTLDSMNNLAIVLRKLGRYEEAEKMQREALEAKEKSLGKDHPDTLTGMNNLASVLQDLGRYEEAEKMHREALEARERTLGKYHPRALDSMNNLASVLRQLGRYEEAEKMQREELEASERTLGKDHSNTLDSMNNLAMVLENLGRYEEAEKMHREALEARGRTLGKYHPRALDSMNNLASVLENLGRYEEAEKMHREALEARERTLGKYHPRALDSMNNLASVLRQLGRYEEAEKMQREELEASERTLGKDHSSTLTSINNLALVLGNLGKYEEAEKMQREALEARGRTLGKDHPNTLDSMNNLAMVLENLGRYEEAEKMHREALEASERTLGKDHPHTLDSMINLTSLLRDLGRNEEADEIEGRYPSTKGRISEQSDDIPEFQEQMQSEGEQDIENPRGGERKGFRKRFEEVFNKFARR